MKRRKITHQERWRVYTRDAGACQICGRQLQFEEMTIDHIIPLEAGGKNELANYQCACRTCNRMKGTMMQDEYYMHITEVFWYLTEKKCGKEFTEKLYRLIQNL